MNQPLTNKDFRINIVAGNNLDCDKTDSDFDFSKTAEVQVDYGRDESLSVFSIAVLKDRYLLEGEGPQDLFKRVAVHYSNNPEQAQRIYDYISKLWFMPATPVLSNGGAQVGKKDKSSRGLPISCFLNETTDSLQGIVSLWNENVWLAAKGGGIGSYWGNLRSIGEKVQGRGKTSGIIPFIIVQNSLTLAISQGSLRRGSSAVYLPVSHPEIEEFIDIRKPVGGDPNRKALNIHHAVVIADDFMRAVEQDLDWALISPKDHSVVRIIKARDLWIRILTTRIETGEPYLLFVDNVEKGLPKSYQELGLKVKMSNLCSEITLATGIDHLGNSRTAVCCLSSLNLEYYEEWKDDPNFIRDIMEFLDNILEDFIMNAPPEMERARYAAMRERSVGLGVMGFHSLLQKKMIPFESISARCLNKIIFSELRKKVDAISKDLATQKGPCPDALEAGIHERFTHKLAIAPTASISIIASNSSPGIEPYAANFYTQKTLSGSFAVKNKYLEAYLCSVNMNTEEIWSSIAVTEGSVQHLDFLSQEMKDVFKTAYELDQRWIIEHAADRTPYICQSQSVNLFLPANVNKKILHNLHFSAWKKGLKSLYYCRSQSIQRSDKVSVRVNTNRSEECLACQ